MSQSVSESFALYINKCLPTFFRAKMTNKSNALSNVLKNTI